jgi:hypothetical protein
MTALRSDLEPLPPKLRSLSIDERGYPVPWFVDWIDGKPEFRAMDRRKFRDAIKKKLCWVCGDPLGVNLAFLAGPMCGINRTSAEPPNHYACAAWSARNCPFLNNPRAVRREDELINNAAFTDDDQPGNAICRNPGVAMVWVCRGYEIWKPPGGGVLITMGEPDRVEWYREGRPATRAEVLQSIETGLPALEVVAESEPGAMADLRRKEQRLAKWLPEMQVVKQ